MVEDLERARARIADQEAKFQIGSTVIDEYTVLRNGVRVRVVARDPNTSWPDAVQGEQLVDIEVPPSSEIIPVQALDRYIDKPNEGLFSRVGDFLAAVRIFGRSTTTRLASIEEE